VEITKRLFEYARDNKHVKFKDGARFREIPIDTSGWDNSQSSAMTHTLPF
jgi:hypothetical protein